MIFPRLRNGGNLAVGFVVSFSLPMCDRMVYVLGTKARIYPFAVYRIALGLLSCGRFGDDGKLISSRE